MMNVNQTFTSIEQIRGQIASQDMPHKSEQTRTEAGQSFDEILFSKHASKRLETRQIDMTEEQRARLQDATTQAREKGMKESLVMVDNLAFIVNVNKNTVITAVNDTKNAVFTNIDGAIIN